MVTDVAVGEGVVIIGDKQSNVYYNYATKMRFYKKLMLTSHCNFNRFCCFTRKVSRERSHLNTVHTML